MYNTNISIILEVVRIHRKFVLKCCLSLWIGRDQSIYIHSIFKMVHFFFFFFFFFVYFTINIYGDIIFYKKIFFFYSIKNLYINENFKLNI